MLCGNCRPTDQAEAGDPARVEEAPEEPVGEEGELDQVPGGEGHPPDLDDVLRGHAPAVFALRKRMLRCDNSQEQI
mgnify:CR=1 FL=1